MSIPVLKKRIDSLTERFNALELKLKEGRVTISNELKCPITKDLCWQGQCAWWNKDLGICSKLCFGKV